MHPHAASAAVLSLLAGPVLLVLAACASETQPSTGISAGPYGGPVATYLVTTRDDVWPAAPGEQLVLKAVDPATGRDLPGHEPLPYGHHGVEAVSPDGRTVALAASTDDAGREPERLVAVDVERWEARDLGVEVAGAQRLLWSPDGRRLYAVAWIWEPCQGSGCSSPRSDLLVIDPHGGELESRAALPFAVTDAGLSPDGRTLYLFGGEHADPRHGEPAPPRLAAYDLKKRRVRAEVELPGVRWGQVLRREARDGQVVLEFPFSYSPGPAMSPDGRRYYVVHPDGDRVTVVDLAAMQVERTAEVTRPQSRLDRLLAWFTGTAHAKSSAGSYRRAAVSPDGRYLYVTGASEDIEVVDPERGETRSSVANLGIQVIDTESFEIVREASTGGQHDYGPAAVDPAGRYLYTYHALDFVILDAHTLEEVVRRRVFPGHVVVGQAPATYAAGR